jgi:hypothetical protein
MWLNPARLTPGRWHMLFARFSPYLMGSDQPACKIRRAEARPYRYKIKDYAGGGLFPQKSRFLDTNWHFVTYRPFPANR